MTLTARVSGFAAATIVLACQSALAEGIAQPNGPVILTVSGEIAHTNSDGTAQFDLAMLESMDPVTIETTTIWTDGPQQFVGVELWRLMEAVGAGADSLNATAINDYAVAIPREDWVKGGAVVAYMNNGKPMSVRDKGPLWVIYPYDANPDYRTEVTYSRSIWQLDRIVVGD